MNETLRRLAALTDPARGRILLVLEQHELAVSELVAVVQMPQSTVSRHLRVLADEGWLATRAEGTSRYYRLASRLDPEASRLWAVVRDAVAEAPESAHDAGRAGDVLARRRTRSQEFFSTAASEWDGVRAELFGSRPELPALLALLDPAWVVGDLGCGTGRLAATVAPYVRRVIGVDESPDMLAAAEERLGGEHDGIELRQGRLEALPIADGELDVAILSLVLHYVGRPERALAEAARVTRVGGRLLVVDMMAHGRDEYRERMGHVWQGFEWPQLSEWLDGAGFEEGRFHRLPAAPEAKGPLLFAAAARRRAAAS